MDVDKLKAYQKKGWNALTESEKTEYSAGMKGAFNLSDALRIQNNISVLGDTLELDLLLPEVTRIPNTEFFQNIVTSVNLIKECGYVYTTTPSVPTLPLNTFEKLNAIEQILDDVYNILMANFYHYTGEIYAGEAVGLLL